MSNLQMGGGNISHRRRLMMMQRGGGDGNLLDYYAHTGGTKSWERWSYPYIYNVIEGADYEISWEKGHATDGYYISVKAYLNDGTNKSLVYVYVNQSSGPHAAYTIPAGTQYLEVTTPSNIGYTKVIKL